MKKREEMKKLLEVNVFRQSEEAKERLLIKMSSCCLFICRERRMKKNLVTILNQWVANLRYVHTGGIRWLAAA